ncbi:MAG TPA: DUF721 domain-containing protein [Pyrinomonadaceae bacterium]|nr:DUF721 domain-containing protein [Acidobacteriota bacterium]HQZ95085.1 DUF721 domain-containing protein [Pyrinomonadaceae bacterium]
MEQLFGAIPTVIGGLESHDKVTEAVVFAAWSRCAGEMLRERTVPISFDKKRLTIAVADKTWQRHLEELSPQMIAKINGSLGQGTVRFIEFQIDEKTVKKACEDRVSESNSRSNAVTPALAKAALAIADENLRKHFLDAAGSYLERQKNS